MGNMSCIMANNMDKIKQLLSETDFLICQKFLRNEINDIVIYGDKKQLLTDILCNEIGGNTMSLDQFIKLLPRTYDDTIKIGFNDSELAKVLTHVDGGLKIITYNWTGYVNDYFDMMTSGGVQNQFGLKLIIIGRDNSADDGIDFTFGDTSMIIRTI